MMGKTEIYAGILQSGSYREEHLCVVMNINVLYREDHFLFKQDAVPADRTSSIQKWFGAKDLARTATLTPSNTTMNRNGQGLIFQRQAVTS